MQVGERVGPFDIDKKIGSGAMGAVYRAKYRKTGQRVAIKMMLLGMADNDVSLARFEREAEVLKQLNHKNIVRFYVASQHRGTPYYAMEYVEGEPLDQILLRKGRLTWEEVVELGRQVCGALQHAHDQGIVHRDLKPSNLMVTADGTIKLTDFGIAKDLDVTQLTSVNCTVGTAAYMSPEQCRGERNLTHKSDLYSLGVVLYELLTGHKPFEAETTMDMFLQHVQGTFERPSREVLDIPVWLDTLVCQLMEKEPTRRPFDANIVSQALDQVAEKVLAQRSAGVDVARSRIADRETRSNANLDETDKAAARTLLTSLRKRRRKRRGKPIYEKKWVQGLVITLALVGIVAMIYQVFRPPSADKLLRQAEKLMASTDVNDWDKAREGPIADYLRYYGEQGDEQTHKVKAWAKERDIATKERQLINLRNKNRDPEGVAGPVARKALDREEMGDLAGARERWNEVSTKGNATAGEEAWAWLAGKRLGNIESALEREQKLLEAAGNLRKGIYFKPSSPIESQMVNAFWYELFDDLDRARDRWQDMKLALTNSSDQRSWYLLATQKAFELDKRLKDLKDDEIKGHRLRLVSDQYKKAADPLDPLVAGKAPVDLRRIQLLLQEIVDFYLSDLDPKVNEIATKSQALLHQITPREAQPGNNKAGSGTP